MLGLLTPGGAEACFDAGSLVRSLTPRPVDAERMRRAAEENKDKFVGPPPMLDPRRQFAPEHAAEPPPLASAVVFDSVHLR